MHWQVRRHHPRTSKSFVSFMGSCSCAYPRALAYGPEFEICAGKQLTLERNAPYHAHRACILPGLEARERPRVQA
jgi:hypothetical protein